MKLARNCFGQKSERLLLRSLLLYAIVLHAGVLHSRFKVIELGLFLRIHYLTKAEGKTISAGINSISFEGVWHKVFPILLGYQTEIVRFGDRLLTILRRYVLDPNTCWGKNYQSNRASI